MTAEQRPIVLITGSSGLLGQRLAGSLSASYTVVGMDRCVDDRHGNEIRVDLTSEESIAEAFEKFRRGHGKRIAAVLHLAAYYDFTGEPHPLCKSLNVEGTERLLEALRAFDVEIFVYPSTMLVHAAGEPWRPSHWRAGYHRIGDQHRFCWKGVGHCRQRQTGSPVRR